MILALLMKIVFVETTSNNIICNVNATYPCSGKYIHPSAYIMLVEETVFLQYSIYILVIGTYYGYIICNASEYYSHEKPIRNITLHALF